jgi:hypothetical protein
MSQKPEILSVEEYKTDAKWLKLENIKWKDQTGKEVGINLDAWTVLIHRENGKRLTGRRGPRRV